MRLDELLLFTLHKIAKVVAKTDFVIQHAAGDCCNFDERLFNHSGFEIAVEFVSEIAIVLSMVTRSSQPTF